jgi:hypothetical protein
MKLEQPLELERLDFESIELERPLATITILKTDFKNSYMRYWNEAGANFGTGISETRKHRTGATFGHNHNPKHSFLNNHFGFIGMVLEQPLALERLDFESFELEHPLAHNHNPKHSFLKIILL